MTVVAMTREMGSRGKDVVAGVAEELRFDVVRHELVESRIAGRMRVRASEVQRYLDGGDGLMERWRHTRRGMHHCTAEQIFEFAAAGGLLIHGWGASQLLRPIPHVLTVRVCAPLDQRVQTLMVRVPLHDAGTARREISASDAAQTRVVKRISGRDWRDPLHYDLVLSTERLSIESCVAQIAALARSPTFQESAHSRAVLAAERARHRRAADGLASMDESPPWRQQAGASGDQPVLREERDLLL